MQLPFEPDPAQRPVQECRTCGAELVPGEDFCHGCGHGVGWSAGDALADRDEHDLNAGRICTACGATHMVLLAQGYPQCETCGYTERH